MTTVAKPETPGFDPIAVELLAAKILRLTIDNFHPQWNAHMRVIAEQLRQVWNARGEADRLAVADLLVAQPENISAPVRYALKKLDRR